MSVCTMLLSTVLTWRVFCRCGFWAGMFGFVLAVHFTTSVS